MLEVASQSFSPKSSPDRELMHGVGLCGPDGELVGIDSKFFLEVGDGGAVLEEKNLLSNEISALVAETQ